MTVCSGFTSPHLPSVRAILGVAYDQGDTALGKLLCVLIFQVYSSLEGFQGQCQIFGLSCSQAGGNTTPSLHPEPPKTRLIRLMIEILHYLKDPELWELWYIPYMGNAGFCIINRTP